MAPVVINRGVNVSDEPAHVPRDQWSELLWLRRDYCRSSIDGDCRLVIQFAQDAEQADWFGLGSREAYLRDGLGLDPRVVEWAIAGLRIIGVDAPVPIARAADTGRKLAAHGGDRKSESVVNQVGNRQLEPVSANGTTREYVIARLDRDAPELAAKVKSGELSANAAAIEAGFRRRPTGLALLRAAWRKSTDDERAAFLAEVSK